LLADGQGTSEVMEGPDRMEVRAAIEDLDCGNAGRERGEKRARTESG
jgi:hypothetical protein